ncbi:MAG: hypothetical protein LQ340_002530 [Diploschistes diacapsis]|nr:MAG: hypothetical protein LQ340_002530 [Diploschistes diacapsis]
MRSFKNAAFGALSVAALVAASDVTGLKKDSFNDFISSHGLVLAEFFAPWCGHCKSLAPEYETAATALKEKDIILVKVDCTEEEDLCKDHNVEGYPTMKIFRGLENVSPYGGSRKSDGIISYMTKQALPPVSTLQSDKLEEFKTADEVVLVGYFAADDKTSNATFLEVATALRDNYLFGATSDASVAKAEGVSQPAIVLYKSFDEGKNTFTEKFEKDAITKFAKTSATPLVGEVSPETYQDYMDAGLPLAYVFAETPEERKELAASLKSVAEKHKGAVNFATIDAKAFGAHAGNLNLEADQWPAFAIQDIAKNLKFPFDQSKKLTEKDVGSFVDDFVAGKVEPSIRSEPIPEKNDGPVKVVVANNYKDIVLDDTKDVLIEFYAPWCGHCKALAPKYEELGQLYKGNPDFDSKVTIAKADATANDVPDEIQGFPTIKLYKAGNKSSPIEFTGDRSVEGLAKFIKESGKYQVDAWVPEKEETKEEKKADLPDAESVGRAAEAATNVAESIADKAKSVGSDATEAVKTAVQDSGTEDEHHDEL